jgi:branched-chain amino acid transport system substrate-binding protein
MNAKIFGLIAGLTFSGAAMAQEPFRIGFLSTMSGVAGILGQDQRHGFDLGVEHLGGKLGGLPVQVIEADDKFSPADAVQQLSRLLDREKVQVITGLVASNVLMAVAKPALARGALLISANAGPSPLAGAGCNPNLFVMSFQNDQWSTGIGKYLSEKGYKRVYFMGMNFQAGWDHTKAAIRNFNGEKVAEVYTPVEQLDFSAELSQLRAAKPDAVYAFYIGGQAIAFVKQFAQAKLGIPLYSGNGLSDPTLFEAQGDAAIGLTLGTHWSAALDNPANKKFVDGFLKAYGRLPSETAANGYDDALLLDAAVKDSGGKTTPDALRESLRRVKYQSIRGDWKFNTNQFPIQNIYMEEVVKNADGKLGLKFLGIAAKDVADPYVGECKMAK